WRAPPIRPAPSGAPSTPYPSHKSGSGRAVSRSAAEGEHTRHRDAGRTDDTRGTREGTDQVGGRRGPESCRLNAPSPAPSVARNVRRRPERLGGQFDLLAHQGDEADGSQHL